MMDRAGLRRQLEREIEERVEVRLPREAGYARYLPASDREDHDPVRAVGLSARFLNVGRERRLAVRARGNEANQIQTAAHGDGGKEARDRLRAAGAQGIWRHGH